MSSKKLKLILFVILVDFLVVTLAVSVVLGVSARVFTTFFVGLPLFLRWESWVSVTVDDAVVVAWFEYWYMHNFIRY